MLSSLSSGSFSMLMGAIVIAASLIGWITDEILTDRAFGIVVNAVFVAAGMVGGLYLFDYLITTHQLSARFLNPYGWLGAAAAGATCALLFFCGLRAAFGR